MAHCDLSRVEGAVELEPIPRNPNGRRPAVVLLRLEWGNVLYAVQVRDDWKEQDYFDLADGLVG